MDQCCESDEDEGRVNVRSGNRGGFGRASWPAGGTEEG